jgi:hypothetical protein
MIREVTILDGETVPVLTAHETLEQELARKEAEEWQEIGAILEAEAERDLTDRLQRSIKASCKHPDRIMHNAGFMPDTNESYRCYNCESCGKSWTEYEEEVA